jgi:Spy/CpxP family protein refolding chaperone
MNKIIISILSALLLTATGTTLAQESYGEREKKGQHQQRGMQAMPMIDKLSRAIRRLDLDDEQKESIKAVMRTMKEEVRPIMELSKAGHHELMQLIKADTYDAQAVAALAEEEGNLAAERMIISSRAISDVFSLLTDEQRNQLETMSAEHRGQRGEGRPNRDAE